MRFISVPTTLEWYMKKVFRMERTIVRYVRPMARRVYDVPLPDDAYFGAIERLFQRLQGVDEILTDPSMTSVRLVTNPEKVVLKETQRAFMYFCLHKMHIDGVIMNRVMPSDVADPYFKDWKASQKRCVEDARAYFDPVPLFLVPLCGEEVLGMDRLKGLSGRIYGERDPLRFFFSGAPYNLAKQNGRYRLTIRLPFAEKGDVELLKKEDELIVRVGSLKRHILLPRPLAGSEPSKARFEGEHLVIHFKANAHDEKSEKRGS
jgi:arsenite-transporting ATPase